MSRFDGRAVVITGAASGVGRATARRIAAEGGTVTCIDIADGGGAGTLELIRADGGTAFALECDVADHGQVALAIEAARANGDGTIDALINCAGTGSYQRFHEVTPEELQRVMAVNFYGPFNTTHAALDALLASRGCIVNVVSAAAVRGSAYLTTYSATKGALLSFTKSFAVEYGPQGVRANAVSPGAIDTPLLRLFTPPAGADPHLMHRSHGLLGRMSTAEEIAATVTFLASDDATQITGTNVLVDTGSTA
ncbi:MAG: 3-oxoacyl-ACP reductase [Ilumatobacteraceae bacterium]|nr:3-oxoacyl-ACP reductase [Ilumatobacteraceae bacterium]